MQRTFRDLLILVAIFGAIWLIFKYVNIFPDETEIVPIDTEEKLGDLIMEDLDDGFNKVQYLRSRKLDSLMHIVNQRLVENIGLTDYEYNIQIIENEQINAVTLPGGNILVYSGLIQFTNTPEELAAVIAHEIGHVEERHVVKRLVKEFTMTLLFSVIAGGDGAILGEIAESSMSNVFNRQQEKDADQYGMDLLLASDISPRNVASFFRRITREKGTYNENLEFLSTHPHNNSRIKASIEYPVPSDFKERPYDIDWDKFKEELVKISKDE